MRNYSLFRKDGRKWVRVDSRAYPKPTAIRIFQSQLIGSAFTSDPLSLRPVPEAKVSHDPLNQCKACADHLHTLCSRGDCNCNCRAFNG